MLSNMDKIKDYIVRAQTYSVPNASHNLMTQALEALQVEMDKRDVDFSICPVCTAGDIVADGRPHIAGMDFVDQKVSCNVCKSDWLETYKAHSHEYINDRSKEK